MHTVSEQVKRMRKERGWSQRELADRAGLSAAHVSLIEKGRKDITLNVTMKLATALGCTVDELAGAANDDGGAAA